jgi:hypothetical protein
VTHQARSPEVRQDRDEMKLRAKEKKKEKCGQKKNSPQWYSPREIRKSSHWNQVP